MSNALIALGLIGAAVFLVGSGSLDGLGKKIKDLLPSGGGGNISNTVISGSGGGGGSIAPISDIAPSSPPVLLEGGAQLVQKGAIDVRSVSQKSADTLQRFRSPDPSIVSDIALFRELQDQQLSNVSTGFSVVLTDAQIAAIRNKPFSSQELADVAALDARREASGDKAALKLSGADTVILKRLEAERARLGVFDSSSVQNPNFNLGLPSDATPADIQLALTQQAEKAEARKKEEINAINREADTQIGAIIESEIEKSGLTQQEFLLSQGINLNSGSNLNQRTLGRLQEQGLIFS